MLRISPRSLEDELEAMLNHPPLRPVQHLLVRAALDQTPYWLRTILGLNGYGLRAWELVVVRHAGELADRLVLETNPAAQACRRMRLPVDYLYA